MNYFKSYILALLVMISCHFSCTQNRHSNSERDISTKKHALKDKLNAYVSRDSMSNAAIADTLRPPVVLPGIQGSWVNVNFKKYILKEEPLFSPSMVPFALIINQKGAVFTNQREHDHFDLLKFRSAAKNQYRYGTMDFIKENDTTISVNNQGRKLVFIKAESSINGIELTRELTPKMIDYSRIKSFVRIDEVSLKADTVPVNCAKSKGSPFILCSTTANDFKYTISYASPLLWTDSFIRAKYYVGIKGLDKEEEVYEMETEQHQVLLKELSNHKVMYKFLY